MLLFFPLRVVPILEVINSVILSFKISLYGKEAIYFMLVKYYAHASGALRND